MSQKLKLEVQISVDGFIASSNGTTDWMVWNWGPDWNWDKGLQEFHTNLTLSAEHILISRQMAEEGFIFHWQNAAKYKKSPQYSFAKHITDTHKIVFSRSLKKTASIPGGWENTDIVNSDFVNAIKKLKQQSTKDILVYGGSTFLSSLIKERIIDEFCFLINPVAIGNGLSIFQSLSEKQELKVVSSQAFNCGVILLVYELL
jgi:dihydrofolate reductase